MAWTYRVTKTAAKSLQKLDPPQQYRLIRFLDERIQGNEDPRQHGKPLKGDHKGLWRFRVGDYRTVADLLQDEIAVVLVLKVAHRRVLQPHLALTDPTFETPHAQNCRQQVDKL